MSQQVHEAPHLRAALEAFWRGDLSYRMPAEAGDVATRHNQFLNGLQRLDAEVRRVTQEVGSAGTFGGQAQVEGLQGSWKRLLEQVNRMGADLAAQFRDIAGAIDSFARGDLTRRVTVECGGEVRELKDIVNGMMGQFHHLASEVIRIAREAGVEGTFGGQAQVRDLAGTWDEVVRNVNTMSGNLTEQVREVSRVVHAIDRGELHWKVHGDMHGEMGLLKDMLNNLTDRVHAVIIEVVRVAREIGEEGRPGGQAHVEGLGDYWEYLTDSVNRMSGILARQAGSGASP
jgi:methyl-accepting chemotaxis protein